MDDRPAQFATSDATPNSSGVFQPGYRQLNDADAASTTDDEESVLVDLNTPSATDDSASVTVAAEEEEVDYEKRPLLTKGAPAFLDADEEPHVSDSKPQESEPCRKFKRLFRRCQRRCQRSDRGEPCCRKLFGRRCRREKRSKVMRAVIFLKLTALLALIAFFVSRFLRGSTHSSHPSFESDSDVAYDYDPSVYSSREIVVHKGSGSIFGRYPLYDLLSLTTKTGSIAVQIDPQPADPEFPDKPARVVLETSTGSISVSFSSPHAASVHGVAMDMERPRCGQGRHEVDEFNEQFNEKDMPCPRRFHSSVNSQVVPMRPYELDIRTKTGSISGRLIYSSSASVETDRGSINAVFIPIVHPDLPSNPSLLTKSNIGSQRIRLQDPIIFSSSSSSSVSAGVNDDTEIPKATHITSAGSLSISYPETWAGSVNATATAGSICLEGHGLKVKKDGRGHASGVRPNGDPDGKVPSWWGSSGKMHVELVTEQAGSIQFFAHSKGHHWMRK